MAKCRPEDIKQEGQPPLQGTLPHDRQIREEGAGARVPRCRVEGMEGAEGHVGRTSYGVRGLKLDLQRGGQGRSGVVPGEGSYGHAANEVLQATLGQVRIRHAPESPEGWRQDLPPACVLGGLGRGGEQQEGHGALFGQRHQAQGLAGAQ